MSVGKDFKHLRRATDKEFIDKNGLWPLLGCAVITLIGTLAFLITFIDSLPE